MLRYECYSRIGKITHFLQIQKKKTVFSFEKVHPSWYTLAQLSVLLLAGSVMYLELYNIYDLIWGSDKDDIFSHFVGIYYFYSTKPFQKLWIFCTSLIGLLRACFLFHSWNEEKTLGELFSWLLYILQILVFSPGYLSKCTLGTCLLRFLVSFVENACQHDI